jgi:hypothetical protein
VVAFAVVGYARRDVHVHDLDRNRLSRSLRGLNLVERECNQLGAGVVRYLYV